MEDENMACEKCKEYEFICKDCGEILWSEYAHIKPFRVIRKEIKNLIWTSDAESFVWVLMFEGRMVKVGQGSLIKLNNETRPNATYIRFDTVLIYYCYNIEESKSLACRLIGELKGIVNRRGVVNSTYKSKTEMRWSTTVNAGMRNMILGEPDFDICGIGYWDVRKLHQFGVS